MKKIKSSKILHGVLGLLILIAVVYISYSGYSKRGSYLWVALSHPIETFVFRHPPEKQHCMPQSLGGSDFTTAYWSRSNHTVSDRWRNRPYLSDSSPNRTLLFGKPSNYKQVMIASKMGRYGLPYSVFFHHYNRDDSRLVSSEFGGTAILVYGWSWFLHIPGKLLNQLAYVIEFGSEPNLLYLIDFIPMTISLIFDCYIALFATFFGFIWGVISSPLVSLYSVGWGFVYALEDTFHAFYYAYVGVVRILPFL